MTHALEIIRFTRRLGLKCLITPAGVTHGVGGLSKRLTTAFKEAAMSVSLSLSLSFSLPKLAGERYD